MTRVDAHQHYWSLQRGDYAWLTQCEGTLYRDFMPEDLPVVTLRTPYREWLDLALALVNRHAPGHEEAVFAGNAIRFYRLDLGGNPS